MMVDKTINNRVYTHWNILVSMETKFEEIALPLVQNVVSFARMSIESDLDLKLIAEKV